MTEDGIARAAEKLKKHIQDDKLSFKDYSLSQDGSDKRSKSEIAEHRHKVKRNKVSFYLSDEAVKAFDQVYIERYSGEQKTDRSTLICEAIDLLAAKQARKRRD